MRRSAISRLIMVPMTFSSPLSKISTKLRTALTRRRELIGDFIAVFR